jgi:hypothetical protein
MEDIMKIHDRENKDKAAPEYGGDKWLAFPKIEGPLSKNVLDASSDIMKGFKEKFGERCTTSYWIKLKEYRTIVGRLSPLQMFLLALSTMTDKD